MAQWPNSQMLITEIYKSLQGESTYAGLPCVFVRLTGCNLRCSWCDSEYTFTGGKRMTSDEIFDEVVRLSPDGGLVEITGGEPMLQERELLPFMGLIVISTLNTIDATKTVERIVNYFPVEEQQSVRERYAKSFRFVVCQRLIPRADGSGRLPVFEILKSNSRTRECVEKGEREGKTILDAIKASESEGMQYFDGEIARLVRAGMFDLEVGASFASNAALLGQELAK